MALSKTSTTKTSKGRPRGEEHWSFKLKKENFDLRRENDRLKFLIENSGITLESVSSSSLEVQKSEKTPIEITTEDPSATNVRDGGDGDGDDDGDDAEPEGDDEPDDFGFNFKVVVVYEEVEHIIYPTDSDEPINDFKLRLQGKFDVPHPFINLSVSETGRDVEDDDPDALLLDFFVNDGDDTVKFDMVVEDVSDDSFYFIEVVEMFGNRGRHRVLIENDMVGLDFAFIISGKVGIPSEAISVYHNDMSIMDYRQMWELDMTSGSTVHFAIVGGGGVGGVKKQYLKKDQALNQLKKFQKEKHMVSDEYDVQDNLLPEPFKEFLKVEQDKISEMLALKVRLGNGFTKSCLHHLDTETLNILKKIFQSNRGRKERHLSSDEKVMKMFPLLFPHLERLENCVSKLQFIQSSIQVDLLHHFTEEFGTYSEAQGSMTLDVQPFVKLLDSEIEKRSESAVPSNQEAIAGNCVLQ